MSVHDATAGFRAYQADALEAIDVFTTRAKGYGFQIETAYRIVPAAACRSTRSRSASPTASAAHSKMSLAVMVEEMLLVTWWGIRDRVLPPRCAQRAAVSRARSTACGTLRERSVRPGALEDLGTTLRANQGSCAS